MRSIAMTFRKICKVACNHTVTKSIHNKYLFSEIPEFGIELFISNETICLFTFLKFKHYGRKIFINILIRGLPQK